MQRQVDHYLRLYKGMNQPRLGIKRETTLNQVTKILCCTQRNTQLIVHKLRALHWITWLPGQGRGKCSHLTFLIDPEDLLMRIAMEYTREWDIKGATTFLLQYDQGFPSIRERFERELEPSLRLVHYNKKRAQQKSTLRFTYNKPLRQLDPAHGYLRSERHMIKQLFDPLITYHPIRDAFEPHLAHYWEKDASKRQWRFYLRKGVLFHHGVPMVAKDVVYSFNRLRKTPVSWMTNPITSVEALDDHTVDICLKEEDTLFLHLLSHESFSILPALDRERPQKWGAYFPRGTGPFKLVRNDQNMVIFEKFDAYFRERALLDRIEIIIDSKEVDTPFNEHHQRWRFDSSTESNVMMLIFNGKKDGLSSNPHFREVLARILDSGKMIEELGGARGREAKSLIDGDHESESGLQDALPIERLLEALPFQEEPLHLYSFDDEDHREDARWIQQQCVVLGIRIQLHLVPVEELIRVETMQMADLILDETTVGDCMELSMLEMLYHEKSFFKHTLSDELQSIIDRDVAKLRHITNHTERQQVLYAIDQKLQEEKVYISFYRNYKRTLSSSTVKGSSTNAEGWVSFEKLWIQGQ
ncbi:ABC transporter substrate-binding protein [Marininema halotolerans]|uniref:ABC transporter substrate-binding protein n=1 Tax=Marininema halotolerans TaxID=1155944 RepID=UPI001FE6973C|nr:ABC transporter substrate-binding protein [Marininema halotolerans]